MEVVPGIAISFALQLMDAHACTMMNLLHNLLSPADPATLRRIVGDYQAAGQNRQLVQRRANGGVAAGALRALAACSKL